MSFQVAALKYPRRHELLYHLLKGVSSVARMREPGPPAPKATCSEGSVSSSWRWRVILLKARKQALPGHLDWRSCLDTCGEPQDRYCEPCEAVSLSIVGDCFPGQDATAKELVLRRTSVARNDDCPTGFWRDHQSHATGPPLFCVCAHLVVYSHLTDSSRL